MRFFSSVAIFIFCLVCSLQLHASLSSQINRLLRSQSHNMQIAVYVENADTGKVLYNDDGSHPMTPASNTKVMTATAAMLYLGPNYHFVTELSTNGYVSKHVVHGNLYVKFSGDPTVKTRDMYALLKALRQKAGIRSIHGNIIIDGSIFSGPYYGLGWPQDDLAYCYAAPVAASIINENCMALQVKRSRRGKPIIRQFTTNFPVINHLKLVGRKALRTCVFQPTITSNNAILLKGCLPSRANWGFSFAIKNPVRYAKQVVQVGLSKAGIAVRGKYLIGKTPGKTRVLATHTSQRLQSILAYMLKHSDNVYAGAVTKLLGAKYYGVGTYKGGSNAIGAILRSRLGKRFKSPYLEDGAGLSSYNLISPIQLAQVYRYMYRQPQLIKDFMKSLAISGQKGTLVYRMTQHGLRGRVFGKTGTLSGVSTLSGYLDMPRKPTVIFAIMMNGVQGSPAHARYLQDHIVQIIARHV